MSGIGDRNQYLREAIDSLLETYNASPALRTAIRHELRKRVYLIRNYVEFSQQEMDLTANFDAVFRLKKKAVYASMADALEKHATETREPTEYGWIYRFAVYVVGEP